LPAEDAAMLFAYSENWADTGVISFYPGGPPAEGATDFLWMALLAGLYKAGIPTYLAAVSMGLLPLLLLAGTVAKRTAPARPGLVRAGIVIVVATSPFFLAHLVGFSILFFGSAIGASMLGLLFRKPAWLYGFGLLACLIRPDGIVFVGGLVAARLADIVMQEHRGTKRYFASLRRDVFLFLVVVAVPLSAYWFGRWGYFNALFPLSFQVKSVAPGSFYFVFVSASNILENARVLLFCAPLLLGAALLPRSSEGKYWTILTLVAVFIPALMFYSRMDLQHNVGSRLQFPFFLVSLILFFSFARERIHVPVIILLSLFSLVSESQHQSGLAFHWYRFQKDTSVIYDLGTQLRTLKGVRVMTSEAGLIPYLSKAESYDTWGLNTPEFAAQMIRPEDVARVNPDLIFVNGDAAVYTSLTGFEEARTVRGWHQHVFNVFLGAKRTGAFEFYQIRLVNSPTDGAAEELLINRNSPFYEQLRRIVRGLPGTRETDFIGDGGCPAHC
jgi:hypothetical protein